MEAFFNIFLFLNFFYYSLEIVPIWKLETSTIELNPNFVNNRYKYDDISKPIDGYPVSLRKYLVKNGDKIEQKNYLSLNNQNEFEVSFDDIESVYTVVGKKVICPKGKYHPYEITSDTQISEIIPDNSIDTQGKNWDLRCYYHGAGFFLVFYLMNGGKNSYGSDFKANTNYFNWKPNQSGSIGNELYDYKLVYGEKSKEDTTWQEYKMAALILNSNNLKLKGFTAKFETNDPYDSSKKDRYYIYGSGSEVTLTENRINNQAYFTDSRDFYFISYNNLSDFCCGYSTYTFPSDNYHNYNDVRFQLYCNSPFEFVDEVEIKEMKMISNRYVQYSILNKLTNENYHGLFDIKSNKILFNTNENLDTFISFSGNSIITTKGNSIYKICPIRNSDNCLDECITEGELLIRDVDGNYCGAKCRDSNKYLIIPENFCDTECDSNIYYADITDETNKRCGLCKDMITDKPYRFIGGTECLGEIPTGAYEYNTKLKLLKCINGYKIDETNLNRCITNCHATCKTCSNYSNNDDDPKCLSCDTDNYYLEGEKCIKIIRTTIINNIPTTIITNMPTTIINNIPTTIIANMPTTIINNIPTTIITTVPKFIMTTIPTPIITTIPKIIITTLPNPIITTIQTTIIKENPTMAPIVCPDEKCLTCNEESNKLALCLTCNEELGYKKVNYTIVLTNFLDCMKPENPKTKKYYYNETLKEYRPCYKVCKQCLKGGNAEANYCLECEAGYMFRPGNNPYNNCVAYSEFYYISSYNQYKSLNIYQCPEEAKYYIKDKKSCIDDCKRDELYKYLYNGNCLKACPVETHNADYVCFLNENRCTLGKNDIYLSYKDNLQIIGTLIKSYISEFYYTNDYISLYQNTNYSIMIYKNGECIKELALEMPDVDFQSCYIKVQEKYGINDKLIIVIIDKKELNNAKTFYSFYHPLSGIKLDAEEVCKNETIVVVESLNSALDKNDTEIFKAQTSLTSQGINIFDLNDPFYTDICYDFDNPFKKDIPLSDRIKIIYPDVELCDEGCEIKSINLEDMTTTCDCLFNDIANNNIMKDNALMESTVGEIFNLINNSNILVFKCFKYIFTHFPSSIGGWISLSLIISQIALTLVFFFVQSTQTIKYIFNLTTNFIKYLSKKRGHTPPKKGFINQVKSDKIKSKSNTNHNLKNKKINNVNGEKNNSDDIVITYNEKKLNKSKDLNINTYIDLKENVKNNDSREELFDKKFFKEYLSTSPEDMEFDDAIVKDQRKYCEHMKENLIEDQIITSTFIAEDPMKPRTIKIMVFVLDVILYFVVNGLFFSEAVISELYNLNEEEENFFSYLPRSINRLIYTTLVSVVVSIITDFFFVEEKKLKGIFRREKNNSKILKEKVVEFIKDLKIRYIAFIIVVSIILIISFFYLLCFNYVYPYSQTEWIKSSITIMIIMQILSLLKCILETSMRFLSYKFNSEKLYKISKFLD